MLQGLVLIAEALTILWFVLFLTLITTTYLEGKSYGVARISRLELAFFRHVKHFVALGIFAVVVVSTCEMLTLVNFG